MGTTRLTVICVVFLLVFVLSWETAHVNAQGIYNLIFLKIMIQMSETVNKSE